ncbi:PIN domain-containing protein [Candidatus Gottesmanbacteria bacterium]|nr:PIN domain-containing protein [Candidatus Gottesmanbacteria bacterium]
MTNIFIDTGAFVALLRQGDKDHQQAREVLLKIEAQKIRTILTDYVIDETYTALLSKEGYRLAMEFDRNLTLGKWSIERITEQRFVKAQEVLRRYNRDKKWSFTDCTSYVVMKELKIKTVFTFDRNFEQMGFKTL